MVIPVLVWYSGGHHVRILYTFNLKNKKGQIKLIVKYQILWFSPIHFLNTGFSTKYETSETKSIDFRLYLLSYYSKNIIFSDRKLKDKILK